MILDDINNIDSYRGISKYMDLAIEYIMYNNIEILPVGKHKIVGDDVFALVQEYETKPITDNVLESHKKYIDIQYVVSGEELIGYAPVEKLKIYKEYDDDNDYMLYEGNYELHKISNGRFAIYFPHDGHKPTINSEKNTVRKIVIKIKSNKTR